MIQKARMRAMVVRLVPLHHRNTIVSSIHLMRRMKNLTRKTRRLLLDAHLLRESLKMQKEAKKLE